MDAIAFAAHNHAACIQTALAEADAFCVRQNLQFTPVRRRVLELLLGEHRAMGAYDLLDHLRREGLGAQPPVAYRALDFLVKNGFAHRVERLNAFVACTHPGATHAPVFLICQTCSAVAESALDRASNPVNRAAKDAGFTLDACVVEAVGLCPKCQSGATA